jgi:hypothetical protein
MVCFSKKLLSAFALAFSVGVLVVGASIPKSVSSSSSQSEPLNSIGRITDDQGNIIATGTLVASRVVLSSASEFVSVDGDPVAADTLRWTSGSGASVGVSSLVWFDEYTSNVQRFGFDSPQTRENAALLLILAEEASTTPSLQISVSSLSTEAYRAIVGYSTAQFSGDSQRSQLRATGAGELTYTRFGSVSSGVYHTGDLKWGFGSEGSPVLTLKDGSWQIEGIVIDGSLSGNDAIVLGIDGGLSNFIEQGISDSGSSVSGADSDGSSVDFNGSRETAVPLVVNKGMRGSIAPGSDLDYYELSISREANYRIESVGDIDIKGELRNAQMQLIAQDDDSGGSVNFRIEALLEAGTYYLVISPFSSSLTGDYGVGVRNMDLTVASDDQGFASSDIIPLQLGNTGNFRLSGVGEMDTFSVVVDQPGHLVIESGGGLDLVGRIFTPNSGGNAPFNDSEISQLFASQDNHLEGDGNTMLDAFVSPGEYLISISAASGFEFGDYQLSTSLKGTSLASFVNANSYQGLQSGIEVESGGSVSQDLEAGSAAVFVFDMSLNGQLDVGIASGSQVSFIAYDASMNELSASETALTEHTIALSTTSNWVYLVIVAESSTSVEVSKN